MRFRWQHAKIKEAISARRVLLLSGARQCGKTTLAMAFADTSNFYRTLDDSGSLNAARLDPHGFVDHGEELMIIDEIQRCPELLPAIKMDVDFNQKPGRFLLTGSANIQSLPSVRESLAGRVRHLRLRPLAQGEIEAERPVFLENLFSKDFRPNAAVTGRRPASLKDVYVGYALKGGYPEALALGDYKRLREWYLDYTEALIEKDLAEIANIKRTDSLRQLLIILAAWSSRFIDFNAIGSGLSLTRATVQTYVNALELLYLVERVPAWTKTVYDRVGKKDKLFMTDTGVMSALLNWNAEKALMDGSVGGILLETFAFTQLAALIEASTRIYRLFHYRDKSRREIDFIVEDEDGAIAGIEVKAGTAISNDSFKHLRWFKNNIVKDKPFVGVVLYTGVHALSFGDNFWALPIDSLWGR